MTPIGRNGPCNTHARLLFGAHETRMSRRDFATY